MVVSFFVSLEAPRKAYSALLVCIPEMQKIIAQGVLIELFTSLIPITLIRFVVFQPQTMAAKAFRERKVQ